METLSSVIMRATLLVGVLFAPIIWLGVPEARVLIISAVAISIWTHGIELTIVALADHYSPAEAA
jgi:hypothetical protein